MCLLGWESSRMQGSRSNFTLFGALEKAPLPSPGSKRGRNCYVAPALAGIPKQGDKIRSGCITPALSRVQNRTELLCSPGVSGAPQTRGQIQKWLRARGFSSAAPGNACQALKVRIVHGTKKAPVG